MRITDATRPAARVGALMQGLMRLRGVVERTIRVLRAHAVRRGARTAANLRQKSCAARAAAVGAPRAAPGMAEHTEPYQRVC